MSHGADHLGVVDVTAIRPSPDTAGVGYCASGNSIPASPCGDPTRCSMLGRMDPLVESFRTWDDPAVRHQSGRLLDEVAPESREMRALAKEICASSDCDAIIEDTRHPYRKWQEIDDGPLAGGGSDQTRGGTRVRRRYHNGRTIVVGPRCCRSPISDRSNNKYR